MSNSNELSTNTGKSQNYPGWQHLSSGKVRELYIPEKADTECLLLVASDRISAFDYLLEPPVTGKGALLTQLSRWWFAQLDVPNHLLDSTVAHPEVPAEIADRAMVVRKLEMLPVECVVRGAITGSGYAEYQATGEVCGVRLEPNLEDGDLLAEPIYTPAFKAPQGAHDENINFEQTVELIGLENAQNLRDISLSIFKTAAAKAAAAGLVLADTKFEFGLCPETKQIVLADEVLTSDSSRYWDAKVYAAETGKARLQSFDKQIVRNWLLENWDRAATQAPPVLPADIVARTLEKYRELYSRLTSLQPPA